MKKKLTSLALVGAFLGLSWYGNVQAQESSGNKIHFINVQEGGSDAIILESNGHFAMVDTGEDYDFPDGSDSRYPWREGIETSYKHVLTDRVFRRLKELGVQKLDFILVTHTHSDHIGNVDELLSTYPVDRVYLKKYSDNRITNSERLWDNLYGYDKVLQTASEKGVSVIQNITQGDAHFQFGDMDIELYNYENETDSSGELKKIWDDNSNSLISVVKVNGKKIYLGGDLDNVHGAEDKYGPLIGKVDLMKFNHHLDTKNSNTKNFIKNLSPEIIVQTSSSPIGSYDSGQEINREYISWLESMGIQHINAASKDYDATVFDIRQDGLVNISTSYKPIPSFQAGWHKSSYGNWWYQAPDSTGEYAVGWNEIKGEWYYFAPSGEMKTGWVKDKEAWYYMDSTGIMKTGEIEVAGHHYYLEESGAMKQGWLKKANDWYFYKTDGSRAIGWIKDKDKWYFLKENGQLLVNGKTPEGYTVDSSGAWLVDVPIEKSATIKTTSHSEIKESKEVVKKDLENKETSQHESVTNSSTSQDLTSSTSQSSETSVNKSESEQ
ncbi:choline binding protein E CbpE [Streptococcus pneumoniae]|uniref:N-acetylmuramoyl-L-alanine amidase family protein n=1 Tax=Streptococcus pneumoniae TaxID=1313 RepID=UPI0010E10DD7|nr:MBL fold metallo-hydrolase [Streptococcus pneumoniae]MBW8123715.1 MBL fold metallo-hydrolase [Streptococcus pneumoniae]VLT68008.1 choline binding protein E CbpE [Streptococcus pneumoniae]VMN71623.1 choline binding protein E CbpE [Streptococcus pneumoniae]VMO72560.1 choline binding protein E CbpE [Streptococcus pneumoniae]VNF55359.1 choline binding protein E CbpE [Streptococcus pneumoniae]